MAVVGEANEPVLEVALFGYDGSVWRKLAVDPSGMTKINMYQSAGELVGQADWHRDRYADSAENLSLTADENTLSLTAISPGDVVVVQLISWRVTSATVSRVMVYLEDGTHNPVILDTGTFVTGRFASLAGPYDLKAGDKISIYVKDATAEDDLEIMAWGRKIED